MTGSQLDLAKRPQELGRAEHQESREAADGEHRRVAAHDGPGASRERRREDHVVVWVLLDDAHVPEELGRYHGGDGRELGEHLSVPRLAPLQPHLDARLVDDAAATDGDGRRPHLLVAEPGYPEDGCRNASPVEDAARRHVRVDDGGGRSVLRPQLAEEVTRAHDEDARQTGEVEQVTVE